MTIEGNLVHALSRLIDCGADIEQRCIHGSTPLLAACSTGSMGCVEQLVQGGANWYARGCNGKTCLQVAQEKKHDSIVAYLKKKDSCEADVFGRDSLRNLQNLVLMNDVAAISRLKSRGVNLDSRHPVRSQSWTAFLNEFIGWQCARFLCHKALQD